MGRQTRTIFRAVAALALVSAGAVATPAVAAASSEATAIQQQAVTFSVSNTNRTAITCQADGQTYQVHGHVTGPSTQLARPDAATLLLHGLSYGEFFTTYTAQPGYDFAEQQAAAGFVTVTIDRLGYDGSDQPPGTGDCIGSQADVAHQIVDQLRSGSYTTDGAASPAFPRVVLAGHSVGGLIAQTEAFTFGGIDGLMVLSYSDQNVSPAARQALQTAVADCNAGGQPSEKGSPGYVAFGSATPEKFIAAHFNTAAADPAVVETTASLRNLDPCGDILSYEAASANALAHVGEITVPVLVLTGGADAIYPVPADPQAALFTGSADVTPVTIAGSGHALTLHLTADQFRAALDGWLGVHGFGSPLPVTGSGATRAIAGWASLALLAGLALSWPARRSRRRLATSTNTERTSLS